VEISGQYFVVSAALYDAYMEQFHLSCDMALALGAVLDDYEHREIMEEGRARLYNLPDEKDFARELAQYNKFLGSFDPVQVVRQADGRVRLPVKAALGLHFMGEYNREMVNFILRAVLTTEYLRRFTERKRQGTPYFGPAALQQTVDVLAAVGRADKAVAVEEEKGRQSRLWRQLVL
jgi:hypothetical protein